MLFKRRANPRKLGKIVVGRRWLAHFTTKTWRNPPSTGWEHSPRPARREGELFDQEKQ
jgi:hypothetical protein